MIPDYSFRLYTEVLATSEIGTLGDSYLRDMHEEKWEEREKKNEQVGK